MAAKKITLSELDSNEKKKLTKVSVLSLLTAFLICLVIVSCVACSSDHSNSKMTEEQEKLYWKSLIPNTEWKVITTEQNKGLLDGQESPLNVKIQYDDENEKFIIYFVETEGGAQVSTGSLELLSAKARIATDDEKVWDAKFSESKDKYYLTITDSSKSAVYYSLNK